MARHTEDEIAIEVMYIASQQTNHIATFAFCYREIPNLLVLNADDMAESPTRPGEAMWEQQVRNIQSHHGSPGNAINRGDLEHMPGVGYRVTAQGIATLRSLGR